MSKRTLLAAMLAAIGAFAATSAQAEFKPSGPIDFVVHGGPGSGNDVTARTLATIIEAEKLAPVRVQVVNKPGGGSTAAANYIYSKKGDNQVIGLYTNIWLTDPLVQEAATHRLVTDMTPIARLTMEPALIVVRADSPIKSMQDFIKMAKEKPGQMKESGGSITSRENVVRQIIQKATGAHWAFISFPSGGRRLAALLGGHVDMMILEPSEATEQVRGGKLRIIASVSPKPLPGFGDVPTLKDSGLPGDDVVQARGVVGTPGMSADAVAYYTDLLRRTTQTKEWKKYLDENSFGGDFLGPKETKEFLTTYEGKIRNTLKEAGLKVVR